MDNNEFKDDRNLDEQKMLDCENIHNDEDQATVDTPAVSPDGAKKEGTGNIEDLSKTTEHGNYNSGYSTKDDGGYSYVYTPKDNPGKKKSHVGRFIAVISCAFLLIVIMATTCLILGINYAKLLSQGLDLLKPDTSTEETTSSPGDQIQESETNKNQEGNSSWLGEFVTQSIYGDVEIEKSPSIKDEGQKLTSAGDAYGTVTQVWEAIGDSVVEIRSQVVSTNVFYGQYTSTSAGSGVIVDDEGFIVTNNHVIEGAKSVSVRLSDGTEYQATLVGTDSGTDIAVLKINPDGKDLVVAPLGCSDDLVVGEQVIAIGNPLGTLGGTVTTGIISATARNVSINNTTMVLLQTSAAINPGNSGGGLFNMAGQLIGVVNAKVAGEDIEGLGFAVPIDTAYVTITELIKYGYVRGIIDHGLTLYDNTQRGGGVYIIESEYTNELVYGDKILTVNGKNISVSSDIDDALSGCAVGDSVVITVSRKGQTIEVTLVLREYVPDSVSFE